MKKNYGLVAIKIQENKKINKSIIEKEIEIMNIIKGYGIFPKIIEHKRYGDLDYIVEALEGQPLYKLLSFSNNIDKYTSYRIGIELFYNIKFFIDANIIHCAI